MMRPTLVLLSLFLTGCSLFSASYPNQTPRLTASLFNPELSSSTGWLIFKPETSATTGVVFYPGGKVEPDAYGALANDLASSAQVLVVIVPMPLDLAVLGSKRAEDVAKEFPQIDTWFLAGHSLGGTMAASLLYDQPMKWQGLMLLASYPQTKHDFSQTRTPVISIIGTLDGLISQERWRQSLDLLPDDATTVTIQGGNHSGFGTYGQQKDDNPAIISPATQRQQTVTAISQWLSTH